MVAKRIDRTVLRGRGCPPTASASRSSENSGPEEVCPSGPISIALAKSSSVPSWSWTIHRQGKLDAEHRKPFYGVLQLVHFLSVAGVGGLQGIDVHEKGFEQLSG
jgi:hypothetical protein